MLDVTIGMNQRWILMLASSCTSQCQCCYSLENPLPLGALGWKPPLDISGELCVASFGFSSTGSIQVSGKTFHWSVQTSYSSGSFLSYCSQHVGRLSSSVSHHKIHLHGFSQPGAQRYASTACNPLAAQRCVLHRQGFSSSVCQAVAWVT